MKKIEFNLRYYNECKPKLTTVDDQVVHLVAIRDTYITYTTNGKMCVSNKLGYALPKGQSNRNLMMLVDDKRSSM